MLEIFILIIWAKFVCSHDNPSIVWVKKLLEWVLLNVTSKICFDLHYNMQNSHCIHNVKTTLFNNILKIVNFKCFKIYVMIIIILSYNCFNLNENWYSLVWHIIYGCLFSISVCR